MKDYSDTSQFKGVSAGNHIRHHTKSFTVRAQEASLAVSKVKDIVVDDPLLSRLFYQTFSVKAIDE
jgi:hypothetical protein